MTHWDIYLALASLSIGWSMHSSISRKVCLRCICQKYTMRLGWKLVHINTKPQFLRRISVAIGGGLVLMVPLLSFIEAVGVKSVLEDIRNARKKIKDVPRSTVQQRKP